MKRKNLTIRLKPPSLPEDRDAVKKDCINSFASGLEGIINANWMEVLAREPFFDLKFSSSILTVMTKTFSEKIIKAEFGKFESLDEDMQNFLGEKRNSITFLELIYSIETS